MKSDKTQKEISIVQTDDPVLREKAQQVKPEDIGSARIKKIIADMKAAVDSQKDGVAIAAPQIGESLRIFVVSCTVMREADPEFKGVGKHLVFINPTIQKLSKKMQSIEEGCLSVRWKYGWVMRALKATVSAYDENGKPFTRGASGILAQVFQHEVDHLEGKLFIDTAKDVHDLPPEEVM
ncbi:MAG: peptide deformylase [Candidatus Pacebacteria bacterium]|nr:peptide deformylase [Candidatus Paceibacterota bacterium]